MAGLTPAAPARRGDAGGAVTVADLTRRAVVVTHPEAEPARSGLTGRARGVTSLVGGAGVSALAVLLDAGREGGGDTDVAGHAAAAAFGAPVETELAGQGLAGGLLGRAGPTIGSTGPTIGALIDANPIHKATQGRRAFAARLVTGQPRRAQVVTDLGAGLHGRARGRLGTAGPTLFVAAAPVGASIPADPLLLVAGDVDAGGAILVAGGAQWAVVFTDVVHHGAGIDALGALEIADLILGAEGDALPRRISPAIILDALIALVVAEIALGALVDALPVRGAGAEHRFELAGHAVLCAAEAPVAVVDAPIAAQSAPIVGAARLADAHTDAAGVVTARARRAVIYAAIFSVSPTLHGNAGHAGAVAARAWVAGLEADVRVEAIGAATGRRWDATSALGVAHQPVGAVVDAERAAVDSTAGPTRDGFTAVAEAVALLPEETVVYALAELVCPAARGRFAPLAVAVALLILGTVVDADAQAVEGTGGGGRWGFTAVALGVAGRPLRTIVHALPVDELTRVRRALLPAHRAVFITTQAVRTAIDTDVLFAPTGGGGLGWDAPIAGVATGEPGGAVVHASIAFPPTRQPWGRVRGRAVTAHLVLAGSQAAVANRSNIR